MHKDKLQSIFIYIDEGGDIVFYKNHHNLRNF